MLALLSALVALGCIAAASRRLVWAVAPTSLDPAAVLSALKAAPPSGRRALCEAIAAREDLDWERDVVRASREADPAARDALLGEQVLELDWRVARWSRVPRVCASIATSAGFLFASVAMLRGLSLPPSDSDPDWLRSVLVSALDALAIGIAGTSFCVAVHLRARRATRERIAAAERLVDWVRSADASP